MKENIHLKISTKEKELLTVQAKELGLSLSAYIRLILKNNRKFQDIVLRGAIVY